MRQVAHISRRLIHHTRACYGSVRFASAQAGVLPNSPSTKYTAVTHPDVPTTVSPQVQELIDRGNKYVLPVYARHPFVLSHGKGAYVWDTEGRKYLDFSAGIAVNALGHADEGVIKVGVIE